MEQKAKEILLEKLEEMAEVTPDTYGDLQGYAVLWTIFNKVDRRREKSQKRSSN